MYPGTGNPATTGKPGVGEATAGDGGGSKICGDTVILILFYYFYILYVYLSHETNKRAKNVLLHAS
ncbi:hypothetical protein GCM10011386_22330 [Parapedobacter defluvii]|uniref:Uncharacterized protein n=1 Tax=Parapedobacter defluvii TaxID=2045106 RepID=A0ABQ1LVH9_9SPHI|nr:hypothetical protein GCM10011386_22330 [Parapedobacter defluvii]